MAHRAVRVTILAALAAALTGCPEPEPPPVEIEEPVAERCSDFTSSDGDAVRDLEIGVLDGEAFTPVTDGDTMEVVRGHQGGYMVVPALSLDGEGLDDDTVCCRVTLRQEIDADITIEPGLQLYVLFERTGDTYLSGYLDGFLTFEPEGLDGMPLDLEAQVQGATFEARRNVRVTLTGPER